MLFYLLGEVEPVPKGAASGVKHPRDAIHAQDIVRWGVWLGRHIC